MMVDNSLLDSEALVLLHRYHLRVLKPYNQQNLTYAAIAKYKSILKIVSAEMDSRGLLRNQTHSVHGKSGHHTDQNKGRKRVQYLDKQPESPSNSVLPTGFNKLFNTHQAN